MRKKTSFRNPEERKIAELFSEVVYHFTYPMVVFSRDGTVKMANLLFYKETGRSQEDVSAGSLNLFDRITTENSRMLEAAQRAFLGETVSLGDMKEPLSMFVKVNEEKITSDCRSVLLFPLAAECGQYLNAVAVFMK